MLNLFRKIRFLLFILFLIVAITHIYSHNVKANGKVQSGNNPYINAYLNEKSTFNTVDEGHLVDPEVENNIIQSTLKSYYEEDLKVANVLKDIFSDKNIMEQTLSINRQDKVNIMHKIIDSFSIIEGENNKDILVDYLERYVLGPNGYDSKTKVFLHEINEESSLGEDNISINKSYNRTAAGNWAYKNYNRYSKNYPKFTGKFGTDCTNFVSQAIHVGGGKPKSGKWTIRKKNSKYWVIDNAKQLNYSWKLSDPSPWISVKQFRKYWKPKSTVHSFSNAYYKKNHKAIYNRNIFKGDIVIFHKGVANFVTIPTHTMIISAYDSKNKDFKLAGHSRVRKAYPLLKAINNYSQIEFLVIK